MADRYEREIQSDMPYTIVGSTSMPQPIHTLTLTAAGIKELAERTKPTDLVKIEQWQDYTDRGEHVRYYQRFVILRDTEAENGSQKA